MHNQDQTCQPKTHRGSSNESYYLQFRIILIQSIVQIFKVLFKKLQLLERMNSDMRMDAMFHAAYVKLQHRYIFNIVLNIFKALIIIVFMPIDYSVGGGTYGILTAFMTAAILVTSANIIFTIWFFLGRIKNQQNVIRFAIQANHGVLEPQADGIVSRRIYNVQNQTEIDSEGLTDEIRARYETIMESVIDRHLRVNSPSFERINAFIKMLSFGNLLFGIIALSTNSSNTTAQIIIITIFLVVEAVSHLAVIIILILLALSPIICCLACLICCCMGTHSGEVVMPVPKLVTINMINQAGKDCSICFQSFKVDEQVIELRCSHKHIFHPICINGWVQMSASCPICRKDIGGK